MGRQAKFDRDEILVCAASEAARGGAVTIQSISAATGAPDGSLYHRFESREQLLAEAWLYGVSQFQAEFLPRLRAAATVEQGVEAALTVPRWSRKHLHLAGLLVLRSQADFLGDQAPQQLRKKAATLNVEVARAVKEFSARTGVSPLRCRLALIGMPYGAIRLFLPGKAPPVEVDGLIAAAYRALVIA